MSIKGGCTICGAERSEIIPFNSDFDRKCSKCGSLEKQRTLAQVMEKSTFDFNKKNWLHITPFFSEEKLVSKYMPNRHDIIKTLSEIKSAIPETASELYDVVLFSSFNVKIDNFDDVLKDIYRILKIGGVLLLPYSSYFFEDYLEAEIVSEIDVPSDHTLDWYIYKKVNGDIIKEKERLFNDATKRISITVDVEAQPMRAEKNHVERLIYGRINGEEWGIGRMMDIADKHDIKITFFLDFAETDLYGDEIIKVGKYIAERGHDLQLHLHPENLSLKNNPKNIKNCDEYEIETAKICMIIF